MTERDISNKVIGAAMEVHSALGPGLLESAYEGSLCAEMTEMNISFERQKVLPVIYKEKEIDCGYRIDLLVENELIVELKSCETLLPIHEAQLLTYLKLSGVKVGLLINFNVLRLKNGIKRMVH
jgi:GxxExxY protein